MSRAPIKAANAPASHVLISGSVSGGIVFSIIVVAYFSVLFAQRALVNLELCPLFRVFASAGHGIYGTKSTMENIHSQYKGPGSSIWADYEYTGRMMLTDDRAGVGVIFLARFRERKDCFYRLKRCGKGGEFNVSGFRTGIAGGKRTNTGLEPMAGVWYRFKVQVMDADSRTRIRARVWKDGSPEPAEWQVECCDAGPARSGKGSVGVWACSEGEKYFDDLLVRRILNRGGEGSPNMGVGPETMDYDSPLSKSHVPWPGEARSHDYLLREDFDRFPVGAHPGEWSSGCAPLDLSVAADRVTSFFGMNLLDFGGPWDEVVDLTAIALIFCFAGFVAAIVLKWRASLRYRMPCAGKKWRIPFEFLPFVVLFAYAGGMRGAAIVICVGLGLLVACFWRLLYVTLIKLFASTSTSEPGADLQRDLRQTARTRG